MSRLIFKKGFTLMELMVVIAIIGILSSVAIVDYSHFKGKGRDARRASELKDLDEAAQNYIQQNYKMPATLSDLMQYFDPGNFPKDPLTGNPYDFESNATHYCLGARMEETTNDTVCDGLLSGSSGDNYKIQGP